ERHDDSVRGWGRQRRGVAPPPALPPLAASCGARRWPSRSGTAHPSTAALPVVQRMRIRYRKVGPARFIGTRELSTVFFRAIRRAGVPIAFSNGHHPLPRIGFGPALPVGVSSDDELVDLELIERREPDAVLAALTR